jgi:hypothetical protein
MSAYIMDNKLDPGKEESYEKAFTPLNANHSLDFPATSRCVSALSRRTGEFVHRVTGRKIEVAPKPRYRHQFV